MMKRMAWVLSWVLLACAARAETNWVREIEIKREPGQNGQDEYTLRILPERTQSYEKLVIECVYHQEFPWQNTKGEKYQKIHEPVSFIYQRPKVDLVNELDAYLSFRVPIRADLLRDKYGERTFHPDVPIVVARLRISGVVESRPVWAVELPAGGTFNVAEVLAKEKERKEKERNRKEDLADLNKTTVQDIKWPK